MSPSSEPWPCYCQADSDGRRKDTNAQKIQAFRATRDHRGSPGSNPYAPPPRAKVPFSSATSLLAPNVCGNPFSIGDPLNTTIESYIINDCPTCSDGHVPTFYTYRDAACYQGAAERPETGFRRALQAV
ncbi:hypothetical protein HO173_001304 [Letharia columbiana]|uniref:Uncharacterized protein n=1 Tax=Letharia columbiana TaxID=112416 RepID=A0A8H6G554_9LECA|nr:uncharacterized protein HO173_001304 [Letharia columbiana]KAF6240632.1 hypothetical protein HO173_001304 [Letharia columbiana]